jgi:hypothetical protein
VSGHAFLNPTGGLLQAERWLPSAQPSEADVEAETKRFEEDDSAMSADAPMTALRGDIVYAPSQAAAASAAPSLADSLFSALGSLLGGREAAAQPDGSAAGGGGATSPRRGPPAPAVVAPFDATALGLLKGDNPSTTREGYPPPLHGWQPHTSV